MHTRTLFAVLSLAALQGSFAAVPWVLVGSPTVSGTFATAADAAGWDVNGNGTYAHNTGPGEDGAAGFGLLIDPDGLASAFATNTSTSAGRTNIFPTGGYAVLTSVFLNPAWGAGSGFNYAVAISTSAAPPGAHRRDFVTSIGYDGTNFQFSASNGTSFTQVNALAPGSNPVSAGPLSSGWYDLQTVFYDAGGVLSADLNLLDSSGTTLATRTLSTPLDEMSLIGGHRYSWMTAIGIPGGNQLGVDSYIIQGIAVVPEPGAALLSGLAGFMFMRRRRA